MADVQMWYSDDNDMIIEVADLINSISSDFINDATVLATLKDTQGVEVAGQTWPLNVPFSGTPGLYQVVANKDIQVLDHIGYILTITAVAPGGLEAEWRIKVGGETRS